MKKILFYITFTVILLTCSLSVLGQSLQLRIFKLKRADGRRLYSVINDFKSQDARVTYDAGTNQIIVMDYPANLVTIENLINELDKQEKNVEVKVLVCETSGNFIERIGLSTGALIIPESKFSGVIRLLGSDENSSIRSEMTIRTLSGYPAHLQVSKEEIFGHSLTHYYNSNSAVTVVSPYRKDVGSFLQVLPIVNGDGTITVVIQPSVSSVNNGRINEQAILSKVILSDGDTVVLGGHNLQKVSSINKTNTFFGIPLSRSTQKSKVNVLMFLTAKVVQ